MSRSRGVQIGAAAIVAIVFLYIWWSTGRIWSLILAGAVLVATIMAAVVRMQRGV